MDLTIIGPVFDPSGYACLTRSIAMELETLGVKVTLRPAPWGAARVSLTEAEEGALARMISRPDAAGPVLYIGVANLFKKHPGRPSIGWTMLETDRIPDQWVRQCNTMDEVWVPTSFNLRTFTSSGVDSEKVAVIPLGTYPERFHPASPPLRLAGRRGFAFLANFEWVPRKGYDILLKAYFQEFRSDEDVSLILKTYDNSRYDPDGRAIKAEVMRFAQDAGVAVPPPVVLLTRVIRPDQMPSLYTAADCYVLPTRGEGWNLPAMEAVSCGIPVIITGWSGHLEFLSPDDSYLIPIDGLEPVPGFGVPNDEIYAGSRWAIPSLDATRCLMRHVFHHRTEARERACRARERVMRRFTWRHSALAALERLSRWAE